MWFDKKPILALAPMADFTNQPFCTICREVAGNDFVIFREMVSAEAVVRENEKTLKMCEIEDFERPVVQQIFGADPKVVAKAAKIIVDRYKPDGIDINMGCPVPKIAGRAECGAALIRDPARAVRIVEALKSANLGVPVSVKTRLGWGSDQDILEFAPKLAEAGADAISVHGRTKAQGYSGNANWEIIGQVKERLDIPLIANGDIVSQADLERCLQVTKADGVMIGRGALGNPWIFIKPGVQEAPDLAGIARVALRHARLNLEHYGNSHGLVAFRKHLVWYFKGIPGVKEYKAELVKVSQIDELTAILNKMSETLVA